MEVYKHTYDLSKQKENLLQMAIIALNHQLKATEKKYQKKLDYLERLKLNMLKKNISSETKFKNENMRYSNKI